MKIPKLVFEDIDHDAFVAVCSKLIPKAAPKFSLKDVVTIKHAFSRHRTPAMVIGFESRQGDGWLYHLARPRDYDGALERITANESDLELVI